MVSLSPSLSSLFLSVADVRQMKFIKKSLDAQKGIPHSIRQNSDHIFDDIVALYRNNTRDILHEFPFRIRYID